MSDDTIPLFYGQITERSGPYDKKDLFFE